MGNRRALIIEYIWFCKLLETRCFRSPWLKSNSVFLLKVTNTARYPKICFIKCSYLLVNVSRRRNEVVISFCMHVESTHFENLWMNIFSWDY